MDDYINQKADIRYPERIKNNVHAQAFYGVISAILENQINLSEHREIVVDIAIEITKIIENHNQVDWSNNTTIHDRIAQDIDDLFFELEQNKGFNLSFDTIDKIIENVKTVALRRF